MALGWMGIRWYGIGRIPRIPPRFPPPSQPRIPIPLDGWDGWMGWMGWMGMALGMVGWMGSLAIRGEEDGVEV